jgi:hypothetical protein
MPAAPLSPLDLISAKVGSTGRPMDFAVLVTVDGIGVDALRRGGRSARHAFLPSGSRVRGRSWEWQQDPPELCAQLQVEDPGAQRAALEAFIDAPMDPHLGLPVRMLLVCCPQGDRLGVRFHHAAFDGISAGLWLVQMLMVAVGGLPETQTVEPWSPPQLQAHPSPARLSKYAWGGASERLWHPGGKPSAQRRWRSLVVDATPLRAAVGRLGGPTYNDLLASAYLQTLSRWNADHGRPAERMGLWLPVNIRQHALEGFGNGSSRVRIYDRCRKESTAAERVRAFREQLSWSREHGEWHVPQDLRLFGWPTWLMVPLLRAFIDRPGVDFGSSVFSHIERLGRAEQLLPMVSEPEWVMTLDKRFPAGMVAATLGEQTTMSLTWDPGMLPELDALELLGLYEQVLAELAEGLR